MGEWTRPEPPESKPPASRASNTLAIAAIVIVMGALLFLAWYAGSQ
jgi:hypothetical protein